jgi:hypothetical protein
MRKRIYQYLAAPRFEKIAGIADVGHPQISYTWLYCSGATGRQDRSETDKSEKGVSQFLH